MSLSGVARTALGVAWVRAEESRRPDRLFDDPYAGAFLAAAPHAFDDERARAGGMAGWGPVFGFHAVIRTRYFDDYLLAACAAGCRQVVLLAAGLDTRAYRLAWPPGVRLFELDLPEVLDFKGRVLSGLAAVPRCDRTVVPVDLRDDWPAALADAGFRPTEPTAWLSEGLLIYLSADEASRLLTTVGELSTPGSRFACEHGRIADAALHARARETATMHRYASMWKGGLGADTADWLTRHGWRVRIDDGAALAARYGRPVPDHAQGRFLTAIRHPTP